jgi:hypothetical protein
MRSLSVRHVLPAGERGLLSPIRQA